MNERDDIAYSKLFFRKSGYISKEFYPYFLSVRRGNKNLSEEYSKGNISQYGKRIYEVVIKHGTLSVHVIKQLCGYSKEDKSKFDKALVDLQMNMYITMCGRQQKLSQVGAEYVLASTVFCTTENFFGEDLFNKVSLLDQTESIQVITNKIRRLNPNAQDNKILKFIKG